MEKYFLYQWVNKRLHIYYLTVIYKKAINLVILEESRGKNLII